MKKSKILIGLSIALFAGIAAFANTNNSKRVTVWYNPGTGCTNIDETICNTGPNPCLGTQAADFGFQLHRLSDCQSPLTKQP